MTCARPLRPRRLSKSSRIGYSKCFLPKRAEPLTIVAFHDRQLSPVALLTNRPVRSAREALFVAEAYLERWPGAEDPIRFLKQEFRLEKFLVDGMDGIRVWFFIIAVVFALLVDLWRDGKIRPQLIRIAQPFKKAVAFPYYRILFGASILQTYILAAHIFRRALTRAP
jgi:hypothetical protein